MSLVSQISLLATRIATEIKSVRSLVPYNVPVTNGTISARRATAQNILASTWTVVQFDAPEFTDPTTFAQDASGAIRCLKSGVYDFDATLQYAAAVNNRRLLRLYRSATPTAQTGTQIDVWEHNPAITGSGVNPSMKVSGSVQCSAGDYLVLQTWHNEGAAGTTLGTIPSATRFSARLPQVFIAGASSLPLQRARMRRIGAFSFVAAQTNWIPWDTEDEDTHLGFSFTTPTTWTVPVGGGGVYKITTRVNIANAAGMGMLTVGVNSASVAVLDRNDMNNSPSSPTTFAGSAEVSLNDGDIVQIGFYAAVAASLYVATSAYGADVSIERVPSSVAVVQRIDSRPPGEITMWGGAAVPAGWLLCDGSYVQKSAYPDLWLAIGDTWKIGAPPAGYFQLPDYRDKMPRGAGSTPLGSTNGSDSSVLPNHVHPHAHTHTVPAHSHPLFTSTNANVSGTAIRNNANSTDLSAVLTSGAASVANTSNPTTQPAIDTIPVHAGVQFMIKAL